MMTTDIVGLLLCIISAIEGSMDLELLRTPCYGPS